MYQAILMHTDIHKGAEVSNVGHCAFQNHPGNQVGNFFHTILELRGFKFRARVAAGFIQFFDDVSHSRNTKFFIGVVRGF